MFGKKKEKYDYYTYESSTPENTKGSAGAAANATSDDTAKSRLKHAPFAVVEAYKSIRTNLIFMLAQNGGGNVLALTSSNASEGKSTTAVNLAVAFSQLENKVLLIDADMRRASLHKKLHIENEKGLSNVLAGFCTFDDAVLQINDKLDLLTAGQLPPNPSELLGSSRFETLIDELKQRYSYIIVDTPPINVVSDALVVAPNVDGLVLVVRDGFTPNYAIKRAIANADFANTKILGAIMNGANPKSGKKYIYRKYSYRSKYYKYGYGYGGYGYGNNSYYSRPEKETTGKK